MYCIRTAPQYILLDSILQRVTKEVKVLIVWFCTDECNLGTFDSLILFTVVVLVNFSHLLFSHAPSCLCWVARLLHQTTLSLRSDCWRIQFKSDTFYESDF